MNDTQTLKKAVAAAAMKYVRSGSVIGVGTGSTADCFIDLLGQSRDLVEGAVASSQRTAQRLESHGIETLDLNMSGDLSIYVDGADEFNPKGHLIKGGGGALTREKIVAGASKQFICIVDYTKQVDVLGAFPLPVEVIPMARSFVARQLVLLGGDPELREGPRTDNGNMILDLCNMEISDPLALERAINDIPGVVTVGLFAQRPADIILMSMPDGSIQTIETG